MRKWKLYVKKEKKSVCIIQRKIIRDYYQTLHTWRKPLLSGCVDFCVSIHCKVWNLITQLHCAVALFERSIEERNLLHKTFIGDEDSKANSALVNSLPYGGDVFINKKEYRAYITKRMSTDLRKLVKNYKVYTVFWLKDFLWKSEHWLLCDASFNLFFFFIYFDFDVIKLLFLLFFSVFIIWKIFLTKLLMQQTNNHQIVFDKQPNSSNL